ncbi:hypothetical protein [Streptomyces achromogenes]|uniref:hypothetical protein n=1 Tax=Streptomyces achromogenes TaxID=67255 RepID=UPI0036F6C642
MATYPQILAGMRITAGLLTSMQPQQFSKAAHTDRASTTTFADDPDLTATLEANATYRVIFRLHYAAVDAARFKTQWRTPANATGARTAVGPDQGAILSGTSSGGAGRWGVHSYATACTYGTRDSTSAQCSAVEEAVLTTSSGGILALQWAQATASTTLTRLAAGSSLFLERLG